MTVTETTPEREMMRRMVVRAIFAHMDDRGIKRSWLASRLGIHRGTVSRYEHGVTPAPERFILEACRALEMLPERFGYTRPTKTQRRAS